MGEVKVLVVFARVKIGALHRLKSAESECTRGGTAGMTRPSKLFLSASTALATRHKMLGRRLGPIVGHFDALPLVGRLGRRLASEARPGKSAGRATSAGRAYLARNAEREGVRATSTGLQYRVLRSGAADAEQPTAASSCECHYRGRLLDGVEFDSMSKARGSGLGQLLSGGSFSAR